MAIEAILCKFVDLFVEPLWTFTRRQLGYIFGHKTYFRQLTDQVKGLDDVRDGVQQSVNSARNNLESIDNSIETWLERVDSNSKEAKEILQHVENRWFYGWCPNLKSRYSLSRKARKRSKELIELIKVRGELKSIAHSKPPQLVEFWSNQGFVGFESRTSTMERIMEAMRKKEITTIGICGMGGVGKTTMIKEVAQRAKKENLVDEVAQAVLSKNPNIRSIQQDVANCLGLSLNEGDSVEVRAARLFERLKNGRRILVIIDDMWTELDWVNVGIPFNKDGITGSKVVLTSRIQDVCKAAEAYVNVQGLTKEEARVLFNQTAEISVGSANNSLVKIGKMIADECKGLPIAIVTIAKALKGKKKHTWKDTLSHLRKSKVRDIAGVHDKVYSCIESSYRYLETDQTRKLLLLCCLFPEDFDIDIEILFRYSVGLCLFGDVDTLDSTRNRVYTLIDQLESSNLLIACKKWKVKLHDVIRDVCMDIAKKEHGYFVGWPEEQAYNSCTAISVKLDKRDKQLPEGLDCHNLQLIRLRDTGRCNKERGELRIPENFFEKMKGIEVVSLEKMRLSSLPVSIGILMNLTALCLEKCYLGTSDLSWIGNLRKLEVLSFFGSKCEMMLPRQMKDLTRLRLLDLRMNSNASFPAGVLSNLKKLEDLYLGDFFGSIRSEEYDQGDCAEIAELNGLLHLNALQLRMLPEMAEELKSSFFKNLKRFDINLSPSRTSSSMPFKNSLILIKLDLNTIINMGIDKLFRKAECASLKEVRGLTDVVGELNPDEGFENLRRLELLRGCSDVEYLFERNHFPPTAAAAAAAAGGSMLMNLEFLSAYELPNLRQLVRGPIKVPCLGHLKTLVIAKCPTVRSLFSSSVAKCLVHIQRLSVGNCETMEQVISKDGEEEEDDDDDTEPVYFPKLEDLDFRSLPKIKVFYPDLKGQLGGRVRRSLMNHVKVGFQNLESLHVSDCSDDVEYLMDAAAAAINSPPAPAPAAAAGSSVAFKNLVALKVRKFNNMIEICHGNLPLGSFASLNTAEFSHLHAMRHLWRGPIQLPSLSHLTHLLISNCPTIRTLFPMSVAKCLLQLTSLEVYKCEMIEEVIVADEGGERGEDDMGTINLLKLKQLSFKQLPKLRGFYPKGKVIFPSLETLTMDGVGSSNILEYIRPEVAISVQLIKCDKIVTVFPTAILSSLNNVSNIRVWFCDSAVEIFEAPGRMEVDEDEQLGEITPSVPKSSQVITFDSLTDVSISGCGSLTSLFHPCIARCLLHLQHLTVSQCKMIRVIVSKGTAGEGDDSWQQPKIVLPQLKNMVLEYLDNLVMVCSGNHDVELPSLTLLDVKGCPTMKSFCAGLPIAPMLNTIKYSDSEEPLRNGHDLNSTLQFLQERIVSKEEEEEEEEEGRFEFQF